MLLKMLIIIIEKRYIIMHDRLFGTYKCINTRISTSTCKHFLQEHLQTCCNNIERFVKNICLQTFI